MFMRLATIVLLLAVAAGLVLGGRAAGEPAPDAGPKPRLVLKGHTGWVNGVAFSPDGKLVASADEDGVVKLWDAAAGKERATFKKHALRAQWVAFAPDGGTLYSGGWDTAVKVWDVAKGGEKATLETLNRPVVFVSGATKQRVVFPVAVQTLTCVALSNDGKSLASASDDVTVKLWDTAAGKAVREFGVYSSPNPAARGNPGGHTGAVEGLAFSPDGKTLATASADKTIKLWDVASAGTARPSSVTPGKVLATFKGHADTVWCLAFSPDGRTLASGGFDKTVKLWDVATGKETATLKGHTDFIRCVAFSRDGRTLASAAKDNTARLWDVATGKQLAVLPHTAIVTSAAFSPDGKTVVTGCTDNTVKLWDVPGGAGQK